MKLPLRKRLVEPLFEREDAGINRSLRVFNRSEGVLDLSNNDYFGLSEDPEIVKTAQEALRLFGCSASASPLITGFGPAHEQLLYALEDWHGYDHGMIWNSGYAANQAILGSLPRKGDIVLADRLIHKSMISGILKSGARLVRYRHCDTEHLEELLEKHDASGRIVFVVTESVFSMDGDYPDLAEIAKLKERYGFFWIVDEAHALGWYGERGSGLVELFGVERSVDILVGTLGKALGSMGAYSLFLDQDVKSYLINFADEFIYSTYLPPSAASAARQAVSRLVALTKERETFAANSLRFRKRLAEEGLQVYLNDSPIVSLLLGEPECALRAARRLEGQGIAVAAIRPPTVPEGSSRLRLSLKAFLSREDLDGIAAKVVAAIGGES